MADLVRQPTVGLESHYGVRVFSLNNWDEFLAWRDQLEAGMSVEHRIGIFDQNANTWQCRRMG